MVDIVIVFAVAKVVLIIVLPVVAGIFRDEFNELHTYIQTFLWITMNIYYKYTYSIDIEDI